MDTDYKVKMSVSLTPVWHIDPPLIEITVDKQPTITEFLHEAKTYQFEYLARHKSFLEIRLLNKNIDDTVIDKGLDKLVHINSIEFFGIENKKFVWSGIYEPEYPDHYIEEQSKAGNFLNKQLSGIDCMGWNGCYRLEFDVPVFTWIHHLQDHGWLFT
jgi:hypothetical protein